MSKKNKNSSPSHGPGPGMPMEKAKNLKGTLVNLAKQLAEYKFSLIIVFIFAIASTIFSIIGPKILGNIITDIFEGLMFKLSGTGGINFSGIARTLLMLLGFYLLSGGFSYVQGLLMSNVAQKYTYNLRKRITAKINVMPMNYFETRTHGEVLSRVTNDVDTLGQSLTQSVSQVIMASTQVIGIFIMMLSISGTMTIVGLLTLPLSMGLMFLIMNKSQKHFTAQQNYLGKVNGQVEEIYGGHSVVRVFNGEDKVKKEFSEANEYLYEAGWKSQFLSGILMPIMMFVGNIGYVVVSILGGYLVVKSKIEVGDIQSFIVYVRNFNQQISQLGQVSTQIQRAAAAAERIFEFLEEEEEVQFAENSVDVSNITSKVEFENVKFGYNKDKVIINNFTSIIEPGQKIAIVGPTGAGKTTIIKLLMRFYDINEGAILIDGHNINDFNRADLRSLFGMVLQDTWLFNGSIMDNIRYGKENASNEEVIKAAKAAFAHHFITTLPDSYNMVLNEEASNVSQGQKQLLTIARAILADPKILILDEATSSVDTRTELRIQQAMDNLMHGRTSFIIAHRLSTIKNADKILVMKDGDIIEQGNHEELIKENGFYANLYNSQFEHTA